MIIHKGDTDLAYEISPMYRESLQARRWPQARRDAQGERQWQRDDTGRHTAEHIAAEDVSE